ncbi:hypothetical protein F2Q68_00038705 [Brassica cretica]|uniref:Uncharacterized protein n=1 Tax=Brassica cretica TaxID=69181 RepID=A0A8S9MBX1_BRACR|nr:hypothetical protein F2Q68_00038705 [Brassica cretica]
MRFKNGNIELEPSGWLGDWISSRTGAKVKIHGRKDGGVVIKPIANWEKHEKDISKNNANALSSIFTSVKKKQLNLIQRFKNANEAWDIAKCGSLNGVKNETSKEDATLSDLNLTYIMEHQIRNLEKELFVV